MEVSNAAVTLPTDQGTCEGAGACVYTAEDTGAGVAEACLPAATAQCAALTALNQTTCDNNPFAWLDDCTFVPAREPVCAALDTGACAAVALGGEMDATRAACYAAGDCSFEHRSECCIIK